MYVQMIFIGDFLSWVAQCHFQNFNWTHTYWFNSDLFYFPNYCWTIGIHNFAWTVFKIIMWVEFLVINFTQHQYVTSVGQSVYQISQTQTGQFCNTCHNVSRSFVHQLYPITVSDKRWTQRLSNFTNTNWTVLQYMSQCEPKFRSSTLPNTDFRFQLKSVWTPLHHCWVTSR